MPGNIGMPELLVIILVILVLFGSKKIPDFAKGLGQGIREFKKAMRDVEENLHDSDRHNSSDTEKRIQDKHF